MNPSVRRKMQQIVKRRSMRPQTVEEAEQKLYAVIDDYGMYSDRFTVQRAVQALIEAVRREQSGDER